MSNNTSTNNWKETLAMVKLVKLFIKKNNTTKLLLMVHLVIFVQILRLSSPVLVGKITDAILNEHFSHAISLVGILTILSLALAAMWPPQIKFTMKLIDDFLASLSITWCSEILKKDFSFFKRTGFGDIIRSFDRAIDIHKWSLRFLVKEALFASVASLLIIIYIIYSGGWWMLLITTAVTLAAILMKFWVFKKRAPYLQEWNQASDEVNSYQIELLRAIKTVQSHGNLDSALETINSSYKKLERSSVKFQFFMSLLEALRVLFPSICSASILFFSLESLTTTNIKNENSLEAGALISLFLLLSRMITSLFSLLDFFSLKNLLVIDSAAFTENVLNTPSSYRISLEDSPITNHTLTLKPFEHAFSPKENVHRTLKNPTKIRIPFGENIAIIGESGQGKSTLASLISAMRKEEDCVFLGNHDVMQISETSLSHHLFYAQHNFSSLQGKLSEALLFGLPVTQNIFSQDIWMSVGLGHRFKEVKKDQVSFESWSQGEKKRLALLRSYLLSRPITILDEPTESLSQQEKVHIWNIIFDFFSEKTLICITHDYSSLESFSKIIEIKNHTLHQR